MEKKYENLMQWVVAGPIFVKALQAVKSNKGSSGVDGMKTDELMTHLKFHWTRTKEVLLRGEYKPQSIRGVKIPKPNGGERQLGIPTVML